MSRTGQRALYFRLGEKVLAVGGEQLRQIVPVGSVTRVPRVGPELLGLFSVRGAILPLVDLRPLLGLSASSEQASVAALVESNGHKLALSVDEVVGFLPYREAQHEAQNHDEREVSPAMRAFSSGTTVYKDLIVPVIDVDKVMSALEHRLVLV